MGLFDWFKALSSGDEKAAQAAVSSAGAIQETAVVNGLDFVAAIEAHRKWKERLIAYVEGTSSEKLDATTICRDDQCALGKWIYHDGLHAAGNRPTFHQVKAKHAEFHVNAAQVVEAVIKGDKATATKLIHEGGFAKSSRDVQALLSKLYMEVQQN